MYTCKKIHKNIHHWDYVMIHKEWLIVKMTTLDQRSKARESLTARCHTSYHTQQHITAHTTLLPASCEHFSGRKVLSGAQNTSDHAAPSWSLCAHQEVTRHNITDQPETQWPQKCWGQCFWPQLPLPGVRTHCHEHNDCQQISGFSCCGNDSSPRLVTPGTSLWSRGNGCLVLF